MIRQELFTEVVEPLHISIAYPPSVNHYWIMARGRIIVTAEAKKYKKTVAYALAGRDLYLGSLTLEIDVYRPRKVGDLDNTLKVILDSLTGVVYKDDSQIVELHVRRFDDKANPRVEITVHSGYLSGRS